MSKDRDGYGNSFHIAGMPTYGGAIGDDGERYEPHFEGDGSFVMKSIDTDTGPQASNPTLNSGESVDPPWQQKAEIMTPEQALENLAKALAEHLEKATTKGKMKTCSACGKKYDPKSSPKIAGGSYCLGCAETADSTIERLESETKKSEQELAKAAGTAIHDRASLHAEENKGTKVESKKDKDGHELGSWNGRITTHPDHQHELEREAAIHEFNNKLPRHEAEGKAYDAYRRKQLAMGAAHHYLGMKAAHSLGDMEEAQRHGALYHLHVKELGHEPIGAVPDEVKQHLETPELAGEKRYKFKQHPADVFLLQGQEPIKKSEPGQEVTHLEHKGKRACGSSGGKMTPNSSQISCPGCRTAMDRIGAEKGVEKSELSVHDALHQVYQFATEMLKKR